MYYYEKDCATEIEDMIMDFLVYRKSRKYQKAPEYKIQDYEIGKGWPYYQDYQLSAQNEVPAKLPLEELRFPEPVPEEYSEPVKPVKPAQKVLPYPKNYSGEMSDKDLTFFSRHYGSICKLLHTHTEEIVNEYEYEGSPIYDELMNKEVLLKIVEKVLSRAQTAEEAVKKITLKMEMEDWSSYHLLRSLAECLVLIEIYICRGPKRRQLVKADWDYSEYI